MDGLLGVGLDYHDSGRSLDKFYKLIRPHISHASIVGLTSSRDAEQFLSVVGDLPIIHHLSNVAPANPEGVIWENLQLQDALSAQMHAAWCNEDIGVWNLGPYNIPYFTPPIFEEDVADVVAANIVSLQEKCSIPFLAEIPSCSFVVGRLSLGDFFSRVVSKSRCELVLDVPHLYSYAIFASQTPSEVLASLPLEAVTHLHVAGGRVLPERPWRYLDNHDDPVIPEVMDLLGLVLRDCPRIKAVTYEIGPNIRDDEVVSEIARLNRYLNDYQFRPSLVPPPRR